MCELYMLLPKNAIYAWSPMALLLASKAAEERGDFRGLVGRLLLISSACVVVSPGFYVSILSKVPAAKLLAPLYYLNEEAVLRAEAGAYAQVIGVFLAALAAMRLRESESHFPLTILLLGLALMLSTFLR